MTSRTRKLVHAGVVALVAAATDIGAQLASGSLNVTRVVLVGLVVGGLARVAGAVLAAEALDPKDGQ